MEQLIEIVSTKIYSFSYLLLTFNSSLQISVWCTLFLILFKSYYIKFERSCATSITWEIFPIKHKIEQSYDHMNNFGKYFWLCFVGNPRLISLTTYHSIRQNQPSVFDDAGCGEDFEIMSMCFRHFAWPFIWTNLNPLYQKKYFMPSLVEFRPVVLEKTNFGKFTTTMTTDNRRIFRRNTHLSFGLRWFNKWYACKLHQFIDLPTLKYGHYVYMNSVYMNTAHVWHAKSHCLYFSNFNKLKDGKLMV